MSDFSNVDDSDISFADTESSENESDDNDDEVRLLVLPWIAVDAEMYGTPYLAIPFTRQTGITQRMPINSAPIEYVKLLSSNPDNGETIFDILVREANLYAEQSIDDANLPPNTRAHSWRPTNGIEMKAFIGIILAMGILKNQH